MRARFEARPYFHPLLGQKWEVWDHLHQRRKIITTEERARKRAAELNLAEARAEASSCATSTS